MAPSAQAHGRSRSLLLLQKVLNQRDNASPLTLILDSLEQTAGPLLREFINKAKIARTKVVFVSFATVRKPREADVFVQGRSKTAKSLSAEILAHCSPASGHEANQKSPQKVLIIIDALNHLVSSEPDLMSSFLSSIITPFASVVVVFHTDIPLVLPKTFSEYEPHPLTLLLHLVTAVFRVSSLYQETERRRAQNRSVQEPGWGLREGREGVLIGLDKSSRETKADGMVLDLEMRKRSGRSVSEKFVLSLDRTKSPTGTAAFSLLTDNPLFAPMRDSGGDEAGGGGEVGDLDTTFSLGLTDKQRRDREGIVLPYYDAKQDIGAGEGGRILYDMGREDDFDDEEDEI